MHRNSKTKQKQEDSEQVCVHRNSKTKQKQEDSEQVCVNRNSKTKQKQEDSKQVCVDRMMLVVSTWNRCETLQSIKMHSIFRSSSGSSYPPFCICCTQHISSFASVSLESAFH